MSKRIIKLIAVILLIIFWVNFVHPISFVYAGDITQLEIKNTKKEEKEIQPSDDFAENILFDGIVKAKQDKSPEPIGAGQAILMLIPNVIIMIAKVFVFVADRMIFTFVDERVTNYPNTNINDFINSPEYTEHFTLDKLFFGDMNILNANFFNFDSNNKDLNTLIKINVAKWHIIISGIALILLLRSNDIFSHKYGFSLCRS